MADHPIDPDVKDPAQPAAVAPDAAPSTAPENPTDLPAQSEPEASGKPPAASEPTPAPNVEPSTPKESKTDHRAPGAERRISELTAKNKELRAKLNRTLAQPATAPAPATVRDEDKPEYWMQKAQTAQTEQERNEASAKWYEADRRQFANQIKNEVRQEQQMQQRASLLSDKLIRVHDKAPFLKESDSGVVEIDINSPVTQRAKELADEAGQSLLNPDGKTLNVNAFLYFVTDAALEYAGTTANQTQAALEQTRVARLKAESRTAGLESSSAPAPSQPSGKKVDLEKEIATLEQQKKSFGNRIDPQLNAKLMTLRSNLRDARLVKK